MWMVDLFTLSSSLTVSAMLLLLSPYQLSLMDTCLNSALFSFTNPKHLRCNMSLSSSHTLRKKKKKSCFPWRPAATVWSLTRSWEILLAAGLKAAIRGGAGVSADLSRRLHTQPGTRWHRKRLLSGPVNDSTHHMKPCFGASLVLHTYTVNYAAGWKLWRVFFSAHEKLHPDIKHTPSIHSIHFL